MEVDFTNDTTLESAEVCRACMGKDSDLKPLFIDQKSSHQLLSDVLLHVTGLNIVESDGLPSHICTTCVALAESAFHFKQMCFQSDMNFRKGLSCEVNSLKPFIKRECDSFVNSDVNSVNFIRANKENVEHILEDSDSKCDNSVQSSVAPYKCGLCCDAFRLCNKLKEHVKTSHGTHLNESKVTSKEKNSCSICAKTFRSKKGYSSHHKRCLNRTEKKVKVKQEIVSDSDSDTPLSEKVTSARTLDSLLSMKPDDVDTVMVENSESHEKMDDDNSFYDIEDTESSYVYCDVKIESGAPNDKDSEEGVKYSCDECNITLTKAMYDAHVKTVHAKKKKSRKQTTKVITINGDITEPAAGDDGWVPQVPSLKCTQCERKFLKESSLNAHLKKHEKEMNEVHKCNTCGREFKRRAHLENHVLTHSVDKGFKCDLCPRAFNKEDSLTIHIANHKGMKKHQCPHCDKGFNMLSTLKDHIRTHTGEKPFLCSICGRGFSQSTNLKEHMRRHQGYKPFKCDFCSQTFVSKGELEAHLRKHSGAHPFVCDECGGGFTTSSSLVKHKRIHTGERPYKCDFCPMRFTALGTMKNHRRTHTGEKPYKCQYCDKAFVQKNDLVTHTRTHTGERPYVCTVCGHAFRQSSALKTHFKIHGGQTDVLNRPTIDESSSSLNMMTPKSENSNL